MDLLARLHGRARETAAHIVLPEGAEPRTLAAAVQASRFCRVTVLGAPEALRRESRAEGLDLGRVCLEAVEPDSREGARLLEAYGEHARPRGFTTSEARAHLRDAALWAAVGVAEGRFDGMVSGAGADEAQTLSAVLRGIGTRPGVRKASAALLVLTGRREIGESGALILADCAVNPDPSPADLAETALLTAETARLFLDVEPRVALLSFSTRASADHPLARRVAEAARIVDARAPGLLVDGELQVDAALVPAVARQKAPGSRLDGRANVLIFPDLSSAHVGSGMLEHLGGARVVGPFLQGLAHPANGLARPGSAADLVDLIALTAIQATAPGSS